MSQEEDAFADLVRRVRAGDDQAATELVRRYEPEIRLEVRVWLRLHHPALRRTFDSMDICQSVLASFFVHAASGAYDLGRPEQLRALLVQMARYKLLKQVKYQQRQRRDVRRAQADAAELDVAADAETPSQLAAGRELLAEFQRRLTDEERRLAELRSAGHDWVAVAAALGGSPEGRRKQLARAVERVSLELGLVPADV